MQVVHLITILFASSIALASATPETKRIVTKRKTSKSTSFNAGFNIQNVVSVAEKIASHSWEYGTLAEALLELYNPEYSVYSKSSYSFPNNAIPTVSSSSVKSLAYVKDKFMLGDGTLYANDGANGDPASLGVSAVLLGENNATLKAAASSQVQHLYSAPRFYNGAISQRNDVAELWADGAHMIMPYMAYYGAATQNLTMIADAANQILLYRDVLLANTTELWKGLWVHIVGPQSQTLGVWATGNGWAALGMARVLAVMKHYTPANNKFIKHEKKLVDAMMAIFNGLNSVDHDSSTKLLRNYLVGNSNNQNDESVEWFGDASGSAALVAAALRLAVLEPSTCSHLYNATRHVRNAVIASINSTGYATPTVDPLDWYSTAPYTQGSPEGQAFIINMYSAWRDCVNHGCCPQPDKEPSQKNHKYSVWGGINSTTSASSSTQTTHTKTTTSHKSTTTTSKATHSSSSHSSSSTKKSTSTSAKSTSTPAPKKGRSVNSLHAKKRARRSQFHN